MLKNAQYVQDAGNSSKVGVMGCGEVRGVFVWSEDVFLYLGGGGEILAYSQEMSIDEAKIGGGW